MISDIRPIEELDRSYRKLVRMAAAARNKGYAPYSKFLVGCAILDGKGRVHTGCNVENAAYLAQCAERTAIGKMVSRGARDPKVVVVLASSDEPSFPCGVCRQMMVEFGRKMKVIAVNRRASVFREAELSDLLPGAFSKEQLTPV